MGSGRRAMRRGRWGGGNREEETGRGRRGVGDWEWDDGEGAMGWGRWGGGQRGGEDGEGGNGVG